MGAGKVADIPQQQTIRHSTLALRSHRIAARKPHFDAWLQVALLTDSTELNRNDLLTTPARVTVSAASSKYLPFVVLVHRLALRQEVRVRAQKLSKGLQAMTSRSRCDFFFLLSLSYFSLFFPKRGGVEEREGGMPTNVRNGQPFLWEISPPKKTGSLVCFFMMPRVLDPSTE